MMEPVRSVIVAALIASVGATPVAAQAGSAEEIAAAAITHLRDALSLAGGPFAIGAASETSIRAETLASLTGGQPHTLETAARCTGAEQMSCDLVLDLVAYWEVRELSQLDAESVVIVKVYNPLILTDGSTVLENRLLRVVLDRVGSLWVVRFSDTIAIG